jgi:Rho GDP-dissociation inhibitor
VKGRQASKFGTKLNEASSNSHSFGVFSLRTMSAAVGAISATKDVAFNPQMEEEELKNNRNSKAGDEVPSHELPHTEDDDGHEDDDDDDDELEEEHAAKLIKSEKELDLGPQVSLKEQLEKDKV